MTTFEPIALFNCCTELVEPDWSQFDWLELGGCIDVNEPDDPNGTCIEGGQSREEAHFFTVYGHLREGGCEAITDAYGFEQGELVGLELARRAGLGLRVEC
nr:hypothetical protein [Methylobacterium sp. ZNC0032]